MSDPGNGAEAPSSSLRRGSQSIDRALSILTSFSVESPDLRLKEICDKTGLTMPTAFRMVKALQDNGFLAHNAESARYSLGPAVAKLAQIMFQNGRLGSLATISRPYLERLRNVTGETAALHIPAESGRVCVVEVESRQMIRMSSGVGCIFPWHAGASSKVLLAGMDLNEQKLALEGTDWSQLTPATPVGINALRVELRVVHDQGFAMSFGETIQGAGAVAVPVRDINGHVAAAINVTGPFFRWTKEAMLDALPAVLSAAREIERELGLSDASRGS